MNIQNDIMAAHQNEITSIRVYKDSRLHGEPSIEVCVLLKDGRTVTGEFTSHPKSGFGGIDFSGPKDISALMISKIKSVLEGTYARE